MARSRKLISQGFQSFYWLAFLGLLPWLLLAKAIAQTPTPSSTPAASPSPTPQVSPTPLPSPKPQNPNEFPPNPLLLKLPDPLLPSPDRPLTQAEREKLISELNTLNAQATAERKQGNLIQAFDIWHRELRLRRSLGLLPEIQALGRVGDVAWSDNQTTEVRWITERLDQILAQTQPVQNKPPVISGNDRIPVLEALGLAYQQIRLPSQAVVAYEEVIADARQRQDAKKVETTQITLATLYLGWFRYENAAATYQELLATARSRNDVTNEITYLNQLAYIHEQAKQPEQAIAFQQQLIDRLQQIRQPDPIPALKIKIADNYQLISRPDLAEQNYQDAFKIAQPLLQFGNAGDALQKLGILYKKNNRLDAALRVYGFLVAVQQQAYNLYGIMDAYDQIGQIHLARQEYAQAAIAFQQGLNYARQLKYREDYFLTQIQKSSPQSNQPQPSQPQPNQTQPNQPQPSR